MTEILVRRNINLLPPKLLKIMIDNMSSSLLKMGMFQQDRSRGKARSCKWGRSRRPLLMKTLLKHAFSFTISAKKSLILSQMEQNYGKVLALLGAVSSKREYLNGEFRKGGLGRRSARVDQAHIFFMKEKASD